MFWWFFRSQKEQSRRQEQMKTGITIATIGATLMLTQNAVALGITCIKCTLETDNTKCLNYGATCCPPCEFEPPNPMECSPSTCSGETVSNMGNGCNKVSTKGCVNNYCSVTITARCRQGYYGTAKLNNLKTQCTGCTACTSPGTTSGPGATQQEECYIPKGFSFSDTSGNGTYADICPW